MIKLSTGIRRRWHIMLGLSAKMHILFTYPAQGATIIISVKLSDYIFELKNKVLLVTSGFLCRPKQISPRIK